MAKQNDFAALDIELGVYLKDAQAKAAVDKLRGIIEKAGVADVFSAARTKGRTGAGQFEYSKGAFLTQRGQPTVRQVQDLSKALKEGGFTANSEFNKIKNAIAGAGDSIGAFDHKIKKSFAGLLLFAGGWQIAYGAINLVKSSIFGSIKDFSDLEMSLLRIKQASGEANVSYGAFAEGAFKVARATGTSVKEVATAARIWAQQGKTVAESLKLTEIAAMGVNLTGQEMTVVISNLTGIMNAWKLSTDELTYAQDKFAKIADASAVEVKDLEDAFLRVGLTAKSVGINMDELSAMVTAVVSITRRAGSEVGDAFKTMFTRFSRADTRNALQTIAQIPTYLDETGAATMRNTGRLRSFTEVIKELAVKYKGLSQTGQGGLMEALTGTRRTEIGKALLEGIDIFNKTMTDKNGALGYTAQKNAEMMGTFEKQTQNLATAFQQLGNSIVASGVINVLTGMVKLFTGLADTARLLVASWQGLLLSTLGLGIGIAALGKHLLELQKIGAASNLTTMLVTNALTLQKKAVYELQFAWLALSENPIFLIMLAGAAAMAYLTTETLKYTEAVGKSNDETTKFYSNQRMLFKEQLQDKNKFSDTKLLETRVKLLKLVREETTRGDLETAGHYAKMIRLIDEENKRRKEGLELTPDEIEDKKKLLSTIEHTGKMQEIFGRNSIAIKMEELALLQKENETRLRGQDLILKQQAIIQEYAKYVYGLRDAFEDAFTNGLEKLIEGTGTLQDMLKEFQSIILKDVLKQATSTFLGDTFNNLSEAVRSPFAQAHIAGITQGAGIIRQAHIDGIVQGFLKAKGLTENVGVMDIGGGGATSQFAKDLIGKYTSGIDNPLGDRFKIPEYNYLKDEKSRTEQIITSLKNQEALSPTSSITSSAERANKVFSMFGDVEQMNKGFAWSGNPNNINNAISNSLIKTNDTQLKILEEQKNLSSINDSLLNINDNTASFGSLTESLLSARGLVGAGGSAGTVSVGGATIAGGGSFLNQFMGGGTKGKPTAGQTAGAALGGGLAAYNAYSSTMATGKGANVGGAIAGGVLQGIGAYAMLMSMGNPITLLGGAVLMGVGMLVSEMSKDKKGKTTTDIKESTQQVTSRINVSNKQLEIVNRNLVALRKTFEGFVMQESYYLRSRSRLGVNVQGEFALNMRRGAQ